MKYLTYEEMEKLSTPRLLAYKKKHFRSAEYPFYVDDSIWDCDCSTCRSHKEEVTAYSTQFGYIKEILAKREHVGK